MRFLFLLASLFIITSASAAMAGPMTFRVYEDMHDCSGCLIIQAEGTITGTTPTVFRELASTYKLGFDRRTVVVLNSPGGSLMGGLSLGREMRSRGFDTHVGSIMIAEDGKPRLEKGDCASACAYAFLGGSKRSIGANSRYGLHQISVASKQTVYLGEAVRSTQQVLAEVERYVRDMGASSEIVTLATGISSNSIRWVDYSELSSFNVVNARGLVTQEPWEMRRSTHFMAQSTTTKGMRELYSISCDPYPYGYPRGNVLVWLSAYHSSVELNPSNSYVRTLIDIKVGSTKRSLGEHRSHFNKSNMQTDSFHVPFTLLRDGLFSGEPLTIRLRFLPSLPGDFPPEDHNVPTEGLLDALKVMQAECPHLGQ